MSAPLVGALGMFSTVLGGITQAQGHMAVGEAKRNTAMYQAGVARINASIAKQNATYTRSQGENSAWQVGLKASAQRGGIKTAQAASGLDVNSGSAKGVQDSHDLLTRMDLATVRANAAKAAYDLDVQASGFENQATLYEMGGENDMMAARINAQSSIIGTASSVADKWMRAGNVGMFNQSLGSSTGTGSVW